LLKKDGFESEQQRIAFTSRTNCL